MEAYESFAYYYDLFMEDVPYDEWVSYLQNIWKRWETSPKLILDLACGTGAITTRLHCLGYEMIGIDASVDMLMVAREKTEEILYLCQDMREIELYGTVDSVVCICDGLNYLLDVADIAKTFRLVHNYLNPQGLFIFDMNTAYKFARVLDGHSFSKVYEDAVCIWENNYDEEEQIMEYDTTFFIESTDGLYERFSELHYEKAYAVEQVILLLQQAGFEFLEVLDAFTFESPNEKSERVYFVAREKGKMHSTDLKV